MQQGNSNRMHGSVANAIRGLQKFRSFGCYNISCSSVITYPKFFVFLIPFVISLQGVEKLIIAVRSDAIDRSKNGRVRTTIMHSQTLTEG